MATFTPPKRSTNLGEAQQRVRHPLERVRGTIRTYVGLEGAALLLTLLAVWFWVTFVLDFGPFRLLGWDWVQEFYAPVRAISLGWLFLCAVVVLRAGLIIRLYGAEVRGISRTAFATTEKRQTLPVWMRLPLVGGAVALVLWGIDLIAGAFGLSFQTVGGFLGVGFLALGLLVLVAAGISGAYELFGVRSSVSRWVRAPLATLGVVVGAFLGAMLGGLLVGQVGLYVGAGLMAIVGEVFVLVSIGIVAGLLRRQGYLVALTVPFVVAYLLGWLAAGFAADVSTFLSGALVLLLMVGPVVGVVIARLLTDFRDDALALVLERRFPEVLGDRLITAVELAHPKKAARYGYSEVMIERTIHDAAEAVQTVPVREVFDWTRLYKQWGLVVLLTLGVYLVAGGLFCIPAIGETGGGGGERAGFAAFHQAAGLALERNVLLENTIWPRRAFLQVLDWPESGERRIGKDDSAPGVKIRAYKWVVADSKTAEGWRALTWNDLVSNKGLLGESVAEINFPAEDEQHHKVWGEPRDPAAGWSLDEIELRLAREEIHEVIDPDTKDRLRDTLSKLEVRAADPAMRRTLRMLIVPQRVAVVYRALSGSTGGTLSLDRQGENEYTGQFPDLKESQIFTARGEDYQTPRYRITVVPPPSLVEMVVDEERPAYMLYRARGDDPNDLRGLKQRVAGRPVSVSGGDTSRIDPVFGGSNLVLTAKSDKELREVVIDEPRKGAAAVKGDVQLLDGHTFQVRFDDVRSTPERPSYDFYFRFVDTDGVKGERHVVIKPQDDAVPDISLDIKVLRKTNQGYMVTPLAYVPMEAKVIDDKGLHKVEYACTVSKLDRAAEQSGRGLLVLSAMHLLPGGPGQEIATMSRIAALSRESKSGPKGGNETGVQRFAVPTFAPAEEFLLLDQIKANLDKGQPLKVNLMKEFLIEKLDELDPRTAGDAPYFFNLDLVKNPAGERLKVTDRDSIQPRYRVQLWMEAVDNDVETGREVLKTDKGVEYRGNRGVSKEKLTFIVVPENDLLSEIAKEEDNLYIKLGDNVHKLQDGLSKLDRVKEDLNSQSFKESQFTGLAARADEMLQTLDKSESAVSEVSTDYQRILKELVVNRVEQAMIDRVQKQIVEPLNIALVGNDEDKNAVENFQKTRDGVSNMRRAIAAEGEFTAKVKNTRDATDVARLRTTALIKRLTDVLDKMEQLADINKLIKALQEIELEENRQKEVLKRIEEQLRNSLFDELKPVQP